MLHNELMVPRAVPTAPYSWGIAVDLDGAVQESQDIKIDINYPVTLVAMHALVITTDGDLVPATLQEILARFMVRHDLRVTSQVRAGNQLPAGLAEAFVPLPALLHDVRQLGMEFPDRVADVSMRFRWARDVAVTPYDDARLFVTLLVSPLGRARLGE